MKFAARILFLLAATLAAVRPALACCCLVDLSPDAEPAAVGLPPCHDAADDLRVDVARADSPACGDCADCADFEAVPAADEPRAVQTADRVFELSPPRGDWPPAAVLRHPVRIAEPPPFPAQPARTPTRLKQRLLI